MLWCVWEVYVVLVGIQARNCCRLSLCPHPPFCATAVIGNSKSTVAVVRAQWTVAKEHACLKKKKMDLTVMMMMMMEDYHNNLHDGLVAL